VPSIAGLDFVTTKVIFPYPKSKADPPADQSLTSLL
jgi:hypothetical protein